MTTEELIRWVQDRYSGLSVDAAGMDDLEVFIRHCRATGRHIDVGDQELWLRGLPVVDVPLFSTRFMLVLYNKQPEWWRPDKPRYVLATGKMHEDFWQVSGDNLTMRQACQAMLKPYLMYERGELEGLG